MLDYIDTLTWGLIMVFFASAYVFALLAEDYLKERRRGNK
jgi:hypothetical protein